MVIPTMESELAQALIRLNEIKRERDEARLEAERMSERLNKQLRYRLQCWRARDKFSWEITRPQENE